MRYQIETFTLCDVWVNTWRDDTDALVTFASYDEALKALINHYAGLRKSAESGFIEPYNMNDFRIAEATL